MNIENNAKTISVGKKRYELLCKIRDDFITCENYGASPKNRMFPKLNKGELKWLLANKLIKLGKRTKEPWGWAQVVLSQAGNAVLEEYESKLPPSKKTEEIQPKEQSEKQEHYR